MKNYKYFPHLLLIFVNFIYGINFSILKAVMPKYIPALGFVFMRIVGAFLLYLLLFIFLRKEKIYKSDIARFAACGFFGISINQFLFFAGMSRTSSINGSLIMICTPIFTLILSTFLTKENFSFQRIFGIFIGAIGGFLLILNSSKSTNNQNVIGDVLIFLNAISYAIYLIIVKPLMNKYKPTTVIFLCFAFALPWAFLIGFKEFLSINFDSIPPIYWINILFVVIVTTFLVYILNVIAISKVSSTVVGSFIYLQPLFAILLSYIVENKNLNIYSTIGGLSIFLGLYLINKRKKNYG